MHYRVFNSTPGLSHWMPADLSNLHDNKKCLQTLPNIPWGREVGGGNSPVGESYWSRGGTTSGRGAAGELGEVDVGRSLRGGQEWHRKGCRLPHLEEVIPEWILGDRGRGEEPALPSLVTS